MLCAVFFKRSKQLFRYRRPGPNVRLDFLGRLFQEFRPGYLNQKDFSFSDNSIVF